MVRKLKSKVEPVNNLKEEGQEEKSTLPVKKETGKNEKSHIKSTKMARPIVSHRSNG